MSEELNAVSYCVGMSIAESLKQQDLDVVSPEAMVEAVKAVFNG
ncbi:MAG: FKBP-type peptidyl-prolyl cis-trans isomerase N-terminal domain-containing protein, partial [Crocinitomicaceae bacterium]